MTHVISILVWGFLEKVGWIYPSSASKFHCHQVMIPDLPFLFVRYLAEKKHALSNESNSLCIILSTLYTSFIIFLQVARLGMCCRWQCEAWIQKNGLSTWCSMVGSNDLTPRVRAKMETMVHDVWHVKTSWTMDFTIVFHFKKTQYYNTFNYSFLSLESKWLLHDSKNLDKSCWKPAIKCCSIAFHFHSHRQSESSADGEEALQSCHLQRLTPPPSETQESVETHPLQDSSVCSCFWNVWTVHVTVKFQNKGWPI